MSKLEITFVFRPPFDHPRYTITGQRPLSPANLSHRDDSNKESEELWIEWRLDRAETNAARTPPRINLVIVYAIPTSPQAWCGLWARFKMSS